MAKTEVNTGQIKDGQVTRSDLNTADTGAAVIRKIIAGDGIVLGSTGVDAGTGDVTVSIDPAFFPKNNYAATVDPEVTDDGPDGEYAVGSRWINTVDGRAWVCLDATDDAAVWVRDDGSGTPGGSDTHVQFNNGGEFGGDSGFVYVDGNVGIGIEAPESLLHVSGDVTIDNTLKGVDGSAADIFIAAGSGPGSTDGGNLHLNGGEGGGGAPSGAPGFVFIGDQTGQATRFGSTADPEMTVDIDGGMRVSGNSGASAGAGIEFVYTGGEGHIFAYDRTGVSYLPLNLDGSEVSLKVGGSEIVEVLGSGANVNGILVVTSDLGVGGTTTFGGVVYTWPGADSTGTQVLSSDGAGNLSWISAGVPGGSSGDIQYNDGAGGFGGHTTVPSANGGTGIDTSADTGIAHVAAGVWSVSAVDLASADVTGLLGAGNGGTGVDTSASTGMPYLTAGVWAIDSQIVSDGFGGVTLVSITSHSGNDLTISSIDSRNIYIYSDHDLVFGASNDLNFEGVNVFFLSDSGLYAFGGTSVSGYFDFNSLTTADKTFVFPDADGEIALSGAVTGTTLTFPGVTSGDALTITFNNQGVITGYTVVP